MGIMSRLLDRVAPTPTDLTVRRVTRLGRVEVTGLPTHLRGRSRRQPDALDLAICAAADGTDLLDDLADRVPAIGRRAA